MPIEPAARLIQYDGNSSPGSTYTIPFHFDDVDHLVVVSNDGAGHVTVLAAGDDYTVSGDGDGVPFTLTPTPPLPTGSLLTIARNAPGEQELDLISGSNPVPAAALTSTLDRLAMAIQDAHPNNGLPFSAALTFPPSERLTGLHATQPQLPDRWARRDGVLSFTANTGEPCVLAIEALQARIVQAAITALTGHLGGPQGPTGASAYELAVANGFTGNEAAWLASLPGVLTVSDVGGGTAVKSGFTAGALGLRTIQGSEPEGDLESTTLPWVQLKVVVDTDEDGSIRISAYAPDAGP